MPRPRPKRRPRKLTRAQRLARAPRLPDGPILGYRLALRKIADSFVRQVRAALRGKLQDFALEQTRADAAADEALDGVTFDMGVAMRGAKAASAGTLRHSQAEFKRLGIKLPEEPPTAKLLKRWQADAAARAEKIFEHEKQAIVDLLADSENRTPDELQDRLEERFLVTKSKLETAAHDDILTLNGRLNQERQTAAGIEEFVWTTAGDGRVRDSHEEVDGQTFRWDDPPEVDGEEAIPGEPYNCRCVPFPVLPELAAQDDEAA